MHASISLRRAFALPISLLLASALVVTTAEQSDAVTRRDRQVERAMDIAADQIGDPYVYGAAGPGSFDCSGLTAYAYGKAGISLPRTSGGQAGAVRRIPRSKLRRGDLIFFHSGGDVYHVGINWGTPKGERLILHAPYSGKNVSFSKIWTDSWFAGTVRPKNGKPIKMLKGGKKEALLMGGHLKSSVQLDKGKHKHKNR